MRTVVLAGLLALLPAAAQAQAEQQRLVDRATLAAQEMLNETDGKDAQYVLRRARATMICPRVFRAGFGIGGQGGSCVLVARDGADVAEHLRALTPERARAIGQAGRARVLAQHTYARRAVILDTLLRETAAGKRAA